MQNFSAVGSFLIGYQILLAIALPFYFYYAPPSMSLVLVTVVLLFLNGISIGAGYHRYYAHKTYRPNKIVEAILLFVATMTMQGSALRWAYNHRMHHRFTDKAGDPHSIKKGFWYAHMLWLFEKSKPIDEVVVPDLIQNKLVLFQHKYFQILTFATNILVCGVIGWLLQDFIGAFVLLWWTRVFVMHHFTWFINSLAHTWGAKTFSREQTAVDNYLIALLTFGEGYHNYHHVFSSDYRNGIRWFHYDPSKWLVWVLSKLGLASQLNKISEFTIQKRIIQEDKSILLEQIHNSSLPEKESLEQHVHQLSARIQSRISGISERLHEYYELKRQQKKEMVDSLRMEIKQMKKTLHDDWQAWKSLSRKILSQS